jgi:hypothetical protein
LDAAAVLHLVNLVNWVNSRLWFCIAAVAVAVLQAVAGHWHHAAVLLARGCLVP